MPRTTPGRWAGALSLVSVVLFGWVVMGINLGILEPGTLPALVSGTAMMVAGIAALVMALVSRFRYKDRSFVVLLAVIIGGLLSLIILGELVQGILMLGNPSR